MSGFLRLALLAILCLIWGSTWLAIKIGLEDLPPFLGAAIRFAIASAVLLLLARIQRVPFPGSRRVHLALLALGLNSFALSYGVVYWAEQYLPSGLTAVLFATHPLLVLVLAHLALSTERITVRRAAGVILGFAGVFLIFRSDLATYEPRAPIAALVLMLSPLTAAASNVAIKRWGTGLHVYNLTTLPMAYGAVVLFAVSLLTEEIGAARWTPMAVGSIVYLALLGSVLAFVIFYTLLKQVAVSSLALISYVFPIVAVILGWIVLGERLAPDAWSGTAAIVAGIALATWRARRGPVETTLPAEPAPGKEAVLSSDASRV
ncbi:MAG: DMT family transporter [Gemmatimonadota bacterium]